MNSEKVRRFMELAGVKEYERLADCPPELRALGAQLLLSETLEYVIKGLGVTPVVGGTAIEDPNGLEYRCEAHAADELEMIDGLADVAYTMFWNAVAFKLPLEQAYEMVCDNNLEKFVPLEGEEHDLGELAPEAWDCGQGVRWPEEVVAVKRLKVHGRWYAVGTDGSGKVRKPSTYAPVDLSCLCVSV